MASSPANLFAQKLRLSTAWRQDWSGGVAGRYGSNYYITLISSADSLVFDSVYINNIGSKLSQDQYGNVRFDKAKHTFTITTGEYHDEYAMRNQSLKPDTTAKAPPVRHFEGAALILYRYKGKRHSFIVKSMQYMKPIAYP